MSDGFTSRKLAILVALNSDTPDKSPKGYVDEPLLPLIVLINNHKDYVTTSSCSGRICTYLEGMNELQSEELYMQDMEAIESRVAQDNGDKDGGEDAQVAKGYEENTSLAAVEAAKRAKGGQWLYVSHDPVVFPSEQDTEDQQWIINTLFGSEAHRVVPMEDSSETRTLDMARSQLVYFKFEPMLDAPIAYIPSTSSTMPSSIPKIHLMVSVAYLRVLVELSNDKFQMNVAQMSRFEKRLAEYLNSDADLASKKMGDQGEWEDKDARRERKRKEGLLKKQQAAMRKAEAETRDAKVQEHSNEDPNTDAGSTAGIATSVQ
ncbi:hypothetical protein BGZ54_009692 [Gamsiella multidivaricata]|nr:hypothetical protein BGZ54_009692 [Gamsiella multidivaricata]